MILFQKLFFGFLYCFMSIRIGDFLWIYNFVLKIKCILVLLNIHENIFSNDFKIIWLTRIFSVNFTKIILYELKEIDENVYLNR